MVVMGDVLITILFLLPVRKGIMEQQIPFCKNIRNDLS